MSIKGFKINNQLERYDYQALDNLPTSVPVGVLVNNEYVKTDGTFDTYNGWSRTGYVDFSSMEKLYITKERGGDYNCFYDSEKVFISSFRLNNGRNEIWPPDDAKYLVISDSDSYMDTLSIDGELKNDYVKHSQAISTVPNNTDYDDLLTPGTYRVDTLANVATMSNCPTVAPHRLDIFQLNISNRIMQVVIPSLIGYNYGLWIRIYDSSSFSPWTNILASSSDSDGIPTYYESHMLSKEVAINKNIASAGFGGDSFALIADPHWGKNSKNSPSLIKHLAKHTPIRRLMLMGDYYPAAQTKSDAYKNLNEVLGSFKDIGMSLYILAGNHDYNPKGPVLSESELYGQLMTGQYDVIRSDDTCTFYFDNPQLKIRYYCTSCNYDDGSKFNVDSYKWIFNDMQSIPAGYKVILFTHSGLGGPVVNNDGGRNAIYAKYLTKALIALKNGTTYTFTKDPDDPDSIISFGSTTYDYTGKAREPIAIFAGHMHVDKVFNDNNIACICTTTDSCGNEDMVVSTLTRTYGTESEQAFDVVTIDPSSYVIYLTRIGAGNNRIVHYDLRSVSTPITLTSELTGAITWSTDKASVAAVSNGVVAKVNSGTCTICASDSNGNAEYWIVSTN